MSLIGLIHGHGHDHKRFCIIHKWEEQSVYAEYPIILALSKILNIKIIIHNPDKSIIEINENSHDTIHLSFIYNESRDKGGHYNLANSSGTKIKDIAPNGDCFYTCILIAREFADCVLNKNGYIENKSKRDDIEEAIHNLRKLSVDYIKENFDNFKDFIEIPSNQEIKYDGILSLSWTCSHCTFDNPNCDKNCKMCNNLKVDKKVHEEQIKLWSCIHCTYENEMYSDNCTICNNKK
jgi:hypothetical protein